MSPTHKCYGGKNGWAICTACLGRIHWPCCTSKKDKHKDCCIERHKMLFEQGQIHGLDDSSLTIYDPKTGAW
jgi:hypothetical protein